MRRTGEPILYAVLPTLFLLLFFLVPLGAVALFALGPETGDAFARIWRSDFHRNRILFTVWQAVLSTGLTLVVGLPAAYLFAHHVFPFRRTLRALFTVPFILPTLVVALALRSLFGTGGPIHDATGFALLDAFGPLGAILIAHVFYDVSLVVRIVGNYWERFPSPLMESARTLGAGHWRAFLTVELPLAWPAIASASLLVFLFTFTSFGVILILAYPARGTIETLIFTEVSGGFPDFQTATILALLQLFFTYLFLIGYLLFQHRTQRTFGLERRTGLRRRLPWPGAAYLGILFLFLVGPLIALGRNAIRVRGEWSLEAFRLLATNDRPLGPYTALDAVGNSLRFATLTLLFALTLGLLVALAANRAPARRRIFVDAYHMLPLGVSAVVIGLGYILAYGGRLGVDLRDTYWRIVLAHTLIAFPFVARILTPTVNRIGESLRGAARTLGAGRWALFARVELPLLRPAIAVAAVYAFAVSLGEFGAALLLRRPEYTTIPVAIFDGFSSHDPNLQIQAVALALVLMLVALAGFLILERLRPKEATGEFA